MNWTQNYLSDRHQSVIIDGKESDSLPVTLYFTSMIYLMYVTPRSLYTPMMLKFLEKSNP